MRKRSWMGSRHEILNYCVWFCFDRSMVTLAYRIIEHFREEAYCPGASDSPTAFPDDLTITDSYGSSRMKLHEIIGAKIMAFVSHDCPVSIVETVMKARGTAEETDTTVIVIPFQQLNDRFMSMQRMVSGGNMLLVDDEQWLKDNLSERPKLPIFIQIEKKHAAKMQESDPE